VHVHVPNDICPWSRRRRLVLVSESVHCNPAAPYTPHEQERAIKGRHISTQNLAHICAAALPLRHLQAHPGSCPRLEILEPCTQAPSHRPLT
jgi:hypothetical protein